MINNELRKFEALKVKHLQSTQKRILYLSLTPRIQKHHSEQHDVTRTSSTPTHHTKWLFDGMIKMMII